MSKKRISSSDAGRALGACKPPVARTCTVCSKVYTTIDPGRSLYCGNTCKCKAARHRRALRAGAAHG
jgi:hypothetical protein